MSNKYLTTDEGEYDIFWEDMLVGGSFFIPCTQLLDVKAALKKAAKKHKYQVVTMSVVEDGMLGVRCWRTA